MFVFNCFVSFCLHVTKSHNTKKTQTQKKDKYQGTSEEYIRNLYAFDIPMTKKMAENEKLVIDAWGNTNTNL